MPDDPTLLCIRDLLQSAQLLCGPRHKVLSYLVGMALEEATQFEIAPHLDRHARPPSAEVQHLAQAVVGIAHADRAAS